MKDENVAEVLETLLDLEDGCRQDGVPWCDIEALFDQAHRCLWACDTVGAYEIMNRICDIWEHHEEGLCLMDD